MKEGFAGGGADFAAAEEAGEGLRRERLADDARVVVGLGEHVRAAAVAGEEQRPARLRAAGAPPSACRRSASAEAPAGAKKGRDWRARTPSAAPEPRSGSP